VLQLLTHRPHQNGAHITSRPEIRERYLKITGKCSRFWPPLYTALGRNRPGLDEHVFQPQNDAVIAPAESLPVDSTIRTILIVDDDRSVADTFARMLKLEGFAVATALSAELGLELAESVRPQAIILDMRMPITNGLQFLRLVRSKPHLADVPVAIVTGDYFLPEAVQLELKALGAQLKFKPLWLEDLVKLAKTLVSA
jgi:CheY-like chemotaxis protein